MRASFYALAGSAASAMAATRGFNYGSQGNTLETFTNQFESAQAITDYASARLYTMIQDGTANTVISAIPAAIKTNTTLLLGLWASENQDAFNNELTALKTAISQFGSQGLADLTVGISVGSEDLYRISETGIKQKSGYGQTADVLVDYIGQVREAVKGTPLANVPIGHVDTWNAYTNTSNSAILGAVDFLGLDEYPFYQDGEGNSIDNASDLFWKAYDKVEAVAGGKPLWVTETGWPVKGATEDEAVPSVENAAKFWQDIACELEARCINFWWYILNDDGASPSFSVASGIDGANTKALYDLKCPNASTCGAKSLSGSSSSSSSAASSSAAGSKTASSGSASTTDAAVAGIKVGSNGTASVEPVVYVTEVTTSYTTTCPAGSPVTISGKETTLTTPTVFVTTHAVSSTVSTSQTSTQVTWAPTSSIAGAIVPSGAVVPSGAALPSGAAAASGSNGVVVGPSGTTLASSWAANQTPGAAGATASPSAYKGAGVKVGGSVALALGAAAAALL
ncbi:glycoside hydrolase [Aureobasidium namibiae CBS 147.97]|uniref:Probable glucan endo-1,3-beta-glucosidase eglC n=1 Tax=Aureobasidium namibiae CBS 147.97 TaxID=1043004 RepID=A0A074WMF8_9PEZI|nr:glycoside hydrolase [Aureobasidium namibiae CBS 147.97]KEQ70957.1 glycoside hydrolase [Aureobasidium namibiae CBS 147.97]